MTTILGAPLVKIRITSTDFLVVSIYGLVSTYKLSPGLADAYRALHSDCIHEKEYSLNGYDNEIPVKAMRATVGK